MFLEQETVPNFGGFGYRRNLTYLNSPRVAVDVVGPESVSNVQKLSLSPSTPVGTQVQVTDGFVVSGFGDARDGFWVFASTLTAYHNVANAVTNDGNDYICKHFPGDGWKFGTDNTSFDVASDSEGANPWDTTWVTAALTLTHPAIQQLASPSTAQGGVFVSGGTQDGIYVYSEDGGQYYLIGSGETRSLIRNDRGDDSHAGEMAWRVRDDSGFHVLYYSLSDVATPDLATNWKNASDDSPASITVTSVTQGELDAGVTVSGAGTSADNGSYPINGNQMGFNQYVLGDFISTLNQSPPTPWSNADYGGASVTSFPWQTIYTLDNGVAPPPTVTRNDVASEANWEVV